MPNGTVESMTSSFNTPAEQRAVVNCSTYTHYSYARSKFFAQILMIVAIVCAIVGTGVGAVPSIADESTDTNTTTDTTTTSQTMIVDPQNLLGDQLTKVSDAITRTKEETGVQVRLIYVESFNTTEQPDVWAMNVLKSLDPAPNTVLLAVASHDGNLSVVVSPNSDEWLRSQQTVDDLSEAATEALVDSKSGQNWAQSAIDMMNAIDTAKRTSVTRATRHTGIIIMIVVLIALVILIVVIIVWRRKHPHTKRRRRHAAKKTYEVSIEDSRINPGLKKSNDSKISQSHSSEDSKESDIEKTEHTES